MGGATGAVAPGTKFLWGAKFQKKKKKVNKCFFFGFFTEYYTSTHAMSAMMPNKKESGVQGRRKIEQEQQAKLAGSLNRFLVNTAESTPISSAAPQEP